MIHEINSETGIAESLDIIQKSFKTVADEFKLNIINAPTHPSFTKLDDLIKLKNEGVNFFGFFSNNQQIGFIAIEKSNENLFFIEKLAVLPSHRHKNYGELLVNFAIDFVKNNNGEKISIGIINEHLILKKWYERFGFKEINVIKFDHLPFTVCFMELNI